MYLTKLEMLKRDQDKEWLIYERKKAESTLVCGLENRHLIEIILVYDLYL